MMGLPYGEEIMIVGRTRWTQSTSVTDRQTDRQTELLSQIPCIAEKQTVIKHAIKLKTSPARLAQLLQPSLAFCFSLQPMTAYRPVAVYGKFAIKGLLI